MFIHQIIIASNLFENYLNNLLKKCNIKIIVFWIDNYNYTMSDNIKCKKCGKKYKYLSYLERHLNGKRDCSIDNVKNDGLYCQHCSRHYVNKFTYERHINTCKSKKQTADIEINNQEIVAAANNMAINQVNNDDNKLAIIDENIRSSLVNLKEKLNKDMENYNMDEITKLLKDLLGKLEKGSGTNNFGTINNTTNNTTNNGTINNTTNNVINANTNIYINHINPFGYETFDHLTTDQKIDLLKSSNAIEQVCRQIYSNDKNKNFISYNIKEDYISFLNSELKSENKSFNDFCKTILPENCITILQRIFYENHHKFNMDAKLAILANIKSQANEEINGYYNIINNIKYAVLEFLRIKVDRENYKKFVDKLQRDSDYMEQKKLITLKLIANIEKFNIARKQRSIDEDYLRSEIWTKEQSDKDTDPYNYKNNLSQHYIEDTPRYKFYKEREEEERSYYDEHGIKFGDIEGYYNILIKRAMDELTRIENDYGINNRGEDEQLDKIYNDAKAVLYDKKFQEIKDKIASVSIQNLNISLE